MRFQEIPREDGGYNLTCILDRTPEFKQKAQEISDFIERLPLTKAENDRLVFLLVEQVQIAEHDAFFQGAEAMTAILAAEPGED